MKVVNYIKNIFVGIWHLGQGMSLSPMLQLLPSEGDAAVSGEPRQAGVRRAVPCAAHHAARRGEPPQMHRLRHVHEQLSERYDTSRRTDGDRPRDRQARSGYSTNTSTTSEAAFSAALCVSVCPTGAIRFTNEFEHAVFTKERLLLQLNRPGSSQAPKPTPAPKPAAPAPEGGAASPEARTESKTE